MHLQDLTFMELQSSKLPEDPNSIRFEKLRNQYATLKKIKLAQAR